MKKSKVLLTSILLGASLVTTSCSLFDFIFENGQTEQVVQISNVPSKIKINLNSLDQKYITPKVSNGDSKATFSFESSNSEVVEIGENGIIIPKSVGEATITIKFNGDSSVKTTCKISVVLEDLADYTIMYYMSGSDLEKDPELKNDNGAFIEGPALFSEDIKEILKVKNIPNSVNILIETGGTTHWYLPSIYLDGANEISSTNLQRWKVENQKLKLIQTLNSNYMAKESSLEDFLSWGLENYAANQMGVVLSGHGGGVAGCCFDDNYTYLYQKKTYPRCLRTYEVAEACKNALAKSSRNKFTWIGYDACNMQCGDVASISADYFDYMVGSQESESGTGWNHDDYLKELVANPEISPEEFLPKICDSFIKENHSFSETNETACLQTLSILDLSKMENFTNEFNNYCEKFVNIPGAYSKLKNAFYSSYNAFGDKCFGVCDFVSFVKQIDKKFTNLDSSKLLRAIDDAVIYNKYCSRYTTALCGVNAFFPESLNSKYLLQVGKEDYENDFSTKFTYWQGMCVEYGDFGWDTI